MEEHKIPEGQTPEEKLISTLRDPANHKEGLASMTMLEAASWLETHSPKIDGKIEDEMQNLINTLNDPINHSQANLTMPMLKAAQEIEKCFQSPQKI